MLTDIRASNNFFGLSYFDPSTATSSTPASGHIGCLAEVTEAQSLPDGRSNILSLGLVRYVAEEYVERGDPYLVARVNFFEDNDEGDEILRSSAHEVAETFTRIARAVRIINDERISLPDISDTEPQRLSFLVAAAMEIDSDVKQELLELRSTSERLDRLSEMLGRAVTSYEERARIHELAKGNGHSGKKIDIE
jgi:Lon protease-like protein